MASAAQYVGTPKNTGATISTANTARDGTGTLGTVYTAGSSGSRIDSIVVQATATTTAGMIRFFISNDAGTTKRLVYELPVVAITPSAAIPAFQAILTSQNSSFMMNGLILQASAILYASTNNAESFNIVSVNAGDF